jgi:aryl-alcohol dehydrogenase-like predicted oxidoreductase
VDHLTLSKTRLNVSRLCFGTMTFGGQTDKRPARKAALNL